MSDSNTVWIDAEKMAKGWIVRVRKDSGNLLREFGPYDNKARASAVAGRVADEARSAGKTVRVGNPSKAYKG